VRPDYDDNTLTLFVGGIFAAFAAFVYILQLPPDERPSWTQIIGRMGTAVVAAWVVGAAANTWFGWEGNLIYAVCGAAGIFGERVFYALASFARSKGYDLEMPQRKEKDGTPRE
jgi:hypothetical protein